VIDQEECELEAAVELGRKYGGEGCYDFKAIGCLYNGHKVYFSNCDTRDTASHQVPVCFKDGSESSNTNDKFQAIIQAIKGIKDQQVNISNKVDRVKSRVDKLLKVPQVLPGWVYVGRGFPASGIASAQGAMSLNECQKKCEAKWVPERSYKDLEWEPYRSHCTCYKEGKGHKTNNPSLHFRMKLE